MAARFIEDLKDGCEAMGAPFSETVLKDIFDAYGASLYDAAIQIGAGSKPGTPILFRVLFAIPLDTLEIALKQGWLDDDDPMVQLQKSLSIQYPQAIEEPEFTMDQGCAALFHYLGDLHPLEEILAIPNMSEAIRANKQQLQALGLNDVLIVHHHYRHKTLGFYFLAKGPLTKETLNQCASLASAPEPSDAIYEDIVGVLLDQPYYLTVVMEFETGKVIRIEFHLLFPVKLPDGMEIPEVGDRIGTFWDIPSYEIEDMDILSFCFGDCPHGQIQGFRSHCGGLRALMQSWRIVGV